MATAEVLAVGLLSWVALALWLALLLKPTFPTDLVDKGKKRPIHGFTGLSLPAFVFANRTTDATRTQTATSTVSRARMGDTPGLGQSHEPIRTTSLGGSTVATVSGLGDHTTGANGWSAEFLASDLPLTASSVVFDAGAHRGDFAHAIHRRYGCPVHCLEPVDIYRAGLDNRPGLIPYVFGLAGENRRAEITIAGIESTVYRRGLEGEMQTVELVTLSEALRLIGVERVDLLKLNVEGCEFEILEQADPSLFQMLLVQFHTFVPDAESRQRRIEERLSLTHRRLWGDDPWIWQLWAER